MAVAMVVPCTTQSNSYTCLLESTGTSNLNARSHSNAIYTNAWSFPFYGAHSQILSSYPETTDQRERSRERRDKKDFQLNVGSSVIISKKEHVYNEFIFSIIYQTNASQ